MYERPDMLLCIGGCHRFTKLWLSSFYRILALMSICALYDGRIVGHLLLGVPLWERHQDLLLPFICYHQCPRWFILFDISIYLIENRDHYHRISGVSYIAPSSLGINIVIDTPYQCHLGESYCKAYITLQSSVYQFGPDHMSYTLIVLCRLFVVPVNTMSNSTLSLAYITVPVYIVLVLVSSNLLYPITSLIGALGCIRSLILPPFLLLTS